MNRKLAAAIATVALLGSSQTLWASEDSTPAADETAQTEVLQQNRHRAERAQRESAASAADALRSGTKLDLDFQLLGHKSITLAGEFREVL